MERIEDRNGVERADILYFAGHGFVGSVQMWETNSEARFERMSYGDSERGLSMAAFNACDVLSSSSVANWLPLMRGGLRMGFGAWGDVVDWHSYGYDFAYHLKAGAPFWFAWFEALNAPFFWENPAAVVAGGRTSEEACDRVMGMTLNNYRSYRRLRGNAIPSAAQLCVLEYR